MLCSRVWGLTPRPTESEPWGSKSTSSTRRPSSASAAPRLIVVVVLPTPPFWLHTATTVAGGRGSGNGGGSPSSGQGRPVGPSSASGTPAVVRSGASGRGAAKSASPSSSGAPASDTSTGGGSAGRACGPSWASTIVCTAPGVGLEVLRTLVRTAQGPGTLGRADHGLSLSEEVLDRGDVAAPAPPAVVRAAAGRVAGTHERPDDADRPHRAVRPARQHRRGDRPPGPHLRH